VATALSPSRSSPRVARQGCDLIVMGTHGRRGIRRLTPGSDAEMGSAPQPLARAGESESCFSQKL